MVSLTPYQIAHYGETRQPVLLGLLITFLVLSNIAVGIRLVSQLRLSRKLFLDDYALIFSILSSDAVIALYIVAERHGLGLHIYRVIADDPHLPSDMLILFRALYVNAALAGATITAVKFSLLWFYRRTFLVNKKWVKVFWWVNLVYIILWGIATTIYYVLQCMPPDYYWQRWYVALKIPHNPPIHGTCKHGTSAEIATPLLLGLISDFAVWMLPIVTLSKLHMNRRKKFGLILIFSLGLVACGCSVARTVLAFDANHAFKDPTYGLVPFVILATGETALGIIAACAPLMASQWNWLAQKAYEKHSTGASSSDTLFRLKAPSFFSSSRPSASGNGSIQTERSGSNRSKEEESDLCFPEPVHQPADGQIQVTRHFDVERTDRNTFD